MIVYDIWALLRQRAFGGGFLCSKVFETLLKLSGNQCSMAFFIYIQELGKLSSAHPDSFLCS